MHAVVEGEGYFHATCATPHHHHMQGFGGVSCAIQQSIYSCNEPGDCLVLNSKEAMVVHCMMCLTALFMCGVFCEARCHNSTHGCYECETETVAGGSERGQHPSMGFTGVTQSSPGTVWRSGVIPMSTDKQSYRNGGRPGKPSCLFLTSMAVHVSCTSLACANRASLAKSMWHSSCV